MVVEFTMLSQGKVIACAKLKSRDDRDLVAIGGIAAAEPKTAVEAESQAFLTPVDTFDAIGGTTDMSLVSAIATGSRRAPER
jgi:hypothetical protein